MLNSFDMGIHVNGRALPDPSAWAYEVADLDTSAKRDSTGYLHRNRVATKVNYEFEWKAIDWMTLQDILGMVSDAKFTLSAPDPRTFQTMWSGEYYVGNRTGNNKWFWQDYDEVALFSLKLKFIQY